MVFGGAVTLVICALCFIFFLLWLTLRLFLIYLKWFHDIRVEYQSIFFDKILNLQINHRLFILNIRSIEFFSSFSLINWRLPTITIHHVQIKIHSKQTNKSKDKFPSTKKFSYLKYLSLRIEDLEIQYKNSQTTFQRLTIYSVNTPNCISSDMWINGEYVELSLVDQSNDILLKSSWKNLEIQTDFRQRLLLNANHWSIEYYQKFLDNYLQTTDISSTKHQSTFRYIDTNFIPETTPKLSTNLLAKFDQYLDYLHDPFFNLSIRQFDLKYISSTTVHVYPTLDTVNFSFHNSSKTSAETRHAYIANFRVHSPSNLVIHGLCQLTISPIRTEITCQFNEFHIQLREETIEQIAHCLPTKNSSSTNSWKFDRQIDLSFQFLNPSFHLKLNEIHSWFIIQLNFLKILFQSDQNLNKKSIIELKNLLLYTVDDLDNKQLRNSQYLFHELEKKHMWNCLIFLPNANINISMKDNISIQSEINGMRLQIDQVFFLIYRRLQTMFHSSKVSNRKSNSAIIDFSLSMKSLSIIICDTKPIYLFLTISTIRLGRTNFDLKKILAFLDGQPSASIPLSSLTSGEKLIDIRRLNLENLFDKSSKLKISILNNLTFVWSTKFHLFLYRFVQSLPIRTRTNSKSSQSLLKQIGLRCDGIVHFYLQLSKDCRIHFELHHLVSEFLNDRSQMNIQCSQMMIDWQKQCIFNLRDISFKRMTHSEQLTTERILLQKSLETLSMISNRASFVEIKSFSIQFPFDSAFNTVVEKLVNIRKWLKRLHGTKGDMSMDFLQEVPKHVNSKDVWTDLSIKIDDFELTIIDDLFEVKLFQNYCLMADEYQERELREQVLQHRIDESQHQFRPLHNAGELRQALSEANSRIYIKRSLQTNYDENKQRIKRNLISWHLKQVNLIAFADQSWTGKENVLNLIHKIDCESTQIPIDETDLCTLWARYVILKCDEWSIHFRDFRQPLWQMQQFNLWGHICAAETTPTSLDSIRTPWVDIGEPYESNPVQVQRLLSPLKFYHDISSDIGSFLISYGPAWENTMAQVNLCLNGITPRANDPSSLLPWWDKIRLYLHGRWSFQSNKMSWLYHVASSPYNDTEEMEWVWDTPFVDWTNGKFIIKATSLSIKLRTSSKYDDCCLLYLPEVDTRISLNWLCQANPNDHHSVRLYTRNAVNSWQKNKPHDSYANYRSHHLKLSAKFECKDCKSKDSRKDSIPPTCTIYASTLRFCERVKNTMMSITRPTRRGRLFLPVGETIVPPRKPLLSRHYESLEFQLIVPQFRVEYLTSFARKTGFQVNCQLFNFITFQELNLIDYSDGLSRRPRILWKPKMMNVHLKRAEAWLLRDANEDKELNEINQKESHKKQTFFLSLDSLIYIRSSSVSSQSSTHSVLIDQLKAVWNLMNRQTVFLIYERYKKNNILRSNLSNPFAKELEHLEHEKNFLPSVVSSSDQSTIDENLMKTTTIQDESILLNANGTTTQHSTLASFLDQLINESQHQTSVDFDPNADASVSLVGLRQCTKDDVEEHTLRIELTDGQIALRGIESRGYIILSAALALVDQYRHKPVWRDEQLCDKTSWQANLQGMQYFATTIASTDHSTEQSSTSNVTNDHNDIIWVPRCDIREESTLLGESSRSVVGSITMNNGSCDQQLQCIISKSNATLSYVFYTEQTQEELSETDIVIPPFVKPSMSESNPIGESDRLLVDSFTLVHHDIQLSTNSSQYRTIMDIVNNLLLYVEPKEEGTNNKLRKLRLQIQLANNLPVLRESIRHLLERVRSTLAELRRLEREIYYYSRDNHIRRHSYSSEDEDGVTLERRFSFTSRENEQLQKPYTSVKIELNKLAEKLGMMCAVYKDMQLARIVKLRIASTSNKLARLERRYELHGGSITWFIKHDDGQITNAQFLLQNILYTKRYYENGTNEHSISIGQAKVDNLLPEDRYRTILTANCQQQQTMIRVYCKEGESVGGIAVKEHLEINVAPLVIQMTRRFSQMLMSFLFPNKSQSNQEMKTSTKHSTFNADQRRTRSAEGDEELLPGRSLFYFSIHDLDAMEKRAKNTLTFQYIKIPEVSLIVSYKIRGTKEKKIGDLENAHISFPTLEYRNLTCSWHDLVLAIKSDVKTVLLSQAIRQNINLRLPFIGKSTRAQNQQLLATTGGSGTTEGTNKIVANSDTMTSHYVANTSEQEEEEQKNKMKLVLGTKISKDLITQFKRRKDN